MISSNSSEAVGNYVGKHRKSFEEGREETGMTTFISEMKVEKKEEYSCLCSITDIQTDKIFTEKMIIDQMDLHKKKPDFYLK